MNNALIFRTPLRSVLLHFKPVSGGALWSRRSISTEAGLVREFSKLVDQGTGHNWPNRNIAKAINEMSRSNDSPNGETTLESLLEEANKDVRMASYSAMDLGVLFHSTCSLISKALEAGTSGITLESFMKSLTNQIVSRKHCLCVSNTYAGNPQALSIIAVSNILFSIRTLPDRVILEKETLLAVILHVLRNHCEKDAVLACRTFHIYSIMESLILLTKSGTEDSWAVMKRLMKEIHRKRGFMSQEDIDYINSIRDLALDKFSDNPIRQGIINKYLV